MNIRTLAVVLLLIIISLNALSQSSLKYNSTHLDYDRAVMLYEKGHYSPAQKIFAKIVGMQGEEYSSYRDDAEYYHALCAINLFNMDAEYLIEHFINSNPESYNSNDAAFELANYQFQKKKYRRALEWYEKVDRLSLSPEANNEYWFKLGYCHFARKDYDKASKAFYEIKDKQGFYNPLAEYFYSHIKYMNGQYQTALLGFQELEDNSLFANIVPYYIIQILYLQDKYEEIMSYAPPMLEKVSGERTAEISRIIGDAYYKTDNFDEAIVYLEKSYDIVKNTSDLDVYQLAYAYYRTQNYNRAAELFQDIGSIDDTLSQNASYHLADCYVRLGNKKSAQLAFASAARIDYNPEISEDALFNFAKLSFELDYTPFNEAIKAFNQYINKYPNSERLDEAYEYLLQAFVNTKNYKGAIDVIEKIQHRTPKIDEAYQRICYLRGLELFINLKYNEAVKMFDKSLSYAQYNSKIEAYCIYWKAEANYRQEDFNKAIKLYTEFLESRGAVNTSEFATAHYNLGYAYFMQKKYNEAGNWFRKYEKQYKGEPNKAVNDALNRIGDCYYINRDYAPATDYYKKSALMGIFDADYALYQMGLAYGGQKKPQEKVWSLTRLVDEHPKSEYIGYAYYEIGKTYSTMLQNPDSAVVYLQHFSQNYPNSPQVKIALADLGSIYYNKRQFDKALATYKSIIANYPNSEEASVANDMIKTIYVEMNDPDAYIDYANTEVPGMIVTPNEQDSITYVSAKKLYLEKDYENALKSFEKYVNKFPDGKYSLDANFYLAELLFYFERPEDALESYKFVADRPVDMYTEESTLKTAGILYEIENYNDALKYYRQLEQIAQKKNNKLIARIGIMRCTHNLGMYEELITACEVVIETDKVEQEVIREANFKKANAYYQLERWMPAYNLYLSLSTEVTSYQGAEAKYRQAEIMYKMGRDTLAEEIVYEFAGLNSPHAYWMAKAFMLLSDIFYDRDDYFQAKHTLQLVLDNYANETDGIKDEARDKLAVILDAEKAKQDADEFLKMSFDEEENDEYDKLIGDEEEEAESEIEETPLNESEPEPKN
ncbi:MAG: tetratricopeptide repeat protein [Bacteroidales bacterium]|jgi:TolA-binding protein|nr:tetratricopeptide repeat protein [Bacteroidales bacterium]